MPGWVIVNKHEVPIVRERAAVADCIVKPKRGRLGLLPCIDPHGLDLRFRLLRGKARGGSEFCLTKRIPGGIITPENL